MIHPFEWVRAVRDAVPGFKPNHQHVLVMLSHRMDANGTGFASGLTLATDTGRSVDTVYRATGDAQKRGYLLRTRRGHRLGNGATAASVWALTLPSQSRKRAVLSPDEPEPQSRKRTVLSHVSTPQTANLNTANGQSQHRRGRSLREPSSREPSSSSARARTETDSRIVTLGAADDDEVQTVREWIEATHHPRNGVDAYVTGIDNEGLADIVAKALTPYRRRRLAEQIAEARRMPECIHGDPGGDQPHPISGEPLCALCRRAMGGGHDG